ncbi:putative leucine-rich repeat domain superfamily [Helianthus debilis subsp. tardiflorus]
MTKVFETNGYFHDYLSIFQQNLRDMALAEVGEGCPLLQDIVLSHCREITDVGLAHLVKRCKWLESWCEFSRGGHCHFNM